MGKQRYQRSTKCVYDAGL